MASRGGSIRLKGFAIVALVVGGAAYYFLVFRPRHVRVEAAYVVPDSVLMVDTPAEVRMVVGELKKGERVSVLKRTRNWVHVRPADGRDGWVEAKALLESQTYEAGQQLLSGLQGLPEQAVGHVTGETNLHLEPSRDAPHLAVLDTNQKVEIFGRRLVERPLPAGSVQNTPPRDAWYLVRAESQAGWALGRMVTLDVPEAIAKYAQDTNLVAWLVLDTVEDEGRREPEYLVADRIGTQEFDFNHIRVFTWWKRRHIYATAYTESRLRGYFPVRTMKHEGIPYFRLRLTDEKGRKFQKVYALFDTRTRLVGTVEGWTTDAMPALPPSRGKRLR